MNIDMINYYLNNNQWMNFKLSGMGINEVRLHGFIDEFEEDKIIIKFNWFFMISALTIRAAATLLPLRKAKRHEALT